jgi:hypothetical protein
VVPVLDGQAALYLLAGAIALATLGRAAPHAGVADLSLEPVSNRG